LLRTLLLWLALAALAVPATPALAALGPAQLGLVINDADPSSVEVGEYYRRARNIPDSNIVHVRLADRPRKLSAEQFQVLKKQIDAGLGPNIQAVLMVWTAPYAVECNSITSAYTRGLDLGLCSRSCTPSEPSPYFDSRADKPYTEVGMRLSMLLPTNSVAQARELIDRGVLSGFRLQPATAYYLKTSDTARNSRARFFPRDIVIPPLQLTVKTLQSDSLRDVSDIIVYQTGMLRVSGLETLKFLPGALADHLTSTGGDLLSDTQMSSLRWLEAGATASYGSVSEPCNFWQKFPQSTVLLNHYLHGATAIEAYWRSVAWPAQGVFIGEPLAAPYARR
jgi:uncharacterized protein (TIGR03790 family)